jgi:GT2 family glycosyltransferase
VVFEEHRQIARSRNTGGKEALGRYLIFVDSDTRISPTLLRTTLAKLESGDYCGGGTTVVFDGDMTFGIRLGTWLWVTLSRTFRWACGAYVFCRREAFLETGGFDERFYASEEIYFSRALRRWGKKKGQRFVILEEPILTSSRKLAWYSPRELFFTTLGLIFNSRRLRDRDACYFWYRRPGDE